jgi:hypothetical protein
MTIDSNNHHQETRACDGPFKTILVECPGYGQRSMTEMRSAYQESRARM